MAHTCNRKGERIDAFMFSQSDGVSNNACDIRSDADDDKVNDRDNDIVIAHELITLKIPLRMMSQTQIPMIPMHTPNVQDMANSLS